MNTTKMQAAAKIVLEGTLETLARIHKTDIQTVRAGLLSGHVKLNAQFKELAEVGINQAIAMHNAGEICIA